MSATILRGDARHLPLADASVDAIVTDPPYGLEFMGKDWDAPWRTGDGFRRSRNPADVGRDNPFGRASRTSPEYLAGRAFQQWCEAWAAECLRVLKPGGFMLAFGGARTWHRLTCAIEDTGFEIRDPIAWLYGQGFPKSLNLGDGRGTALKPAFEPVVFARKPLVGTVAANVEAYGTGALNIDACRIPTDDTLRGTGKAPLAFGGANHRPYHDREARPAVQHDAGRWPTNVVLDEHTAHELDQQSGVLKSGRLESHHRRRGGSQIGTFGIRDRSGEECSFGGDVGGASRFFPVFRYEAKADGAERPRVNGVAHPTVKPLDLMRWLIRLVTPTGGIVLDPFAGSGTTLEAALLEGFRVVAIERDPDYLPLIAYRLDRARRRLQPGVARLALSKPPVQLDGQLDLLEAS